MYPPSDPWQEREEPTTSVPPAMYGRAQVPLREPTAPLPVVTSSRQRPAGPPRVSWQRAGKASRRTLSDGWGLTAFGLLVLICGWGLWAAAGGTALAHPLLDLGVVLAVGVLLFIVLRSVGRYLIEGLMHRHRPHARWSHFFTGTYLAGLGVFYFVHARWLVDGVAWLQQQWQHL